jgi:hypothetical protein
MEFQEALEDIEIAFRQLEFAIKLLSFCELSSINPADFDTDHVVLLEGGNLHFPTGQFSDQDSLNRRQASLCCLHLVHLYLAAAGMRYQFSYPPSWSM